MEEIIYDIWLSKALKFTSGKVKFIKSLYNNISDFYNGGETEWRLSGCLTVKELENLKNEPLNNSVKEFELAQKLGYKVIPLFSEKYPHLLEQIYNPPGVLYVKGNVEILNSALPVSIVGTRRATCYGKQMAFEIGKNLSLAGATVVSGGAMGIDSAAHRGALAGGGNTIAVLGCGINYPYLMRNKKMREEISKTGAVISEFPPNYPGNIYTFPIRNRVIAGLSLGTLVIEAGEKSGSLISANFACEQNRDVFVVPVEESSPLSKGPMSLIKDGAQVITSAQDILNNYMIKPDIKENLEKFKKNINSEIDNISEFYQTDNKTHHIKKEAVEKNKIDKNAQISPIFAELSEDAKSVYKEIQNGRIHIDELSKKTNISIKLLLPIITELELLGLIRLVAGRMYEII